MFRLSLFAVVLIQAAIVVTGIALPLYAEVRTVAGRSAFERGARLSFGDAFYEYVRFIRETVPEDGRIVLPPVSVDATYGNMGIMQFFLAPRGIVNCPAEDEIRECLQLFSGERTYFLAIRQYPDPADYGGRRNLIPLNDALGLLAPAE